MTTGQDASTEQSWTFLIFILRFQLVDYTDCKRQVYSEKEEQYQSVGIEGP